MYHSNDIPAVITPVVDEFLTLELWQPGLSAAPLEYRIYSAGDKLVRKGFFNGTGIQLRLSPLSPGAYHFSLYANGKAIEHSTIEVIHDPVLFA